MIPLLLLLFFLSFFTARFSASASISVVEHQVVSERRLLQVKKPCSINFEKQNYSIITSQCKDPYPPEPCCSGFKEFACPFVDEINDLDTECAEKMMSYISTVGQYPSSLFASICREGKDGLKCPEQPPSPTPNTARNNHHHLLLLLLLLFPLLFLV